MSIVGIVNNEGKTWKVCTSAIIIIIIIRRMLQHRELSNGKSKRAGDVVREARTMQA